MSRAPRDHSSDDEPNEPGAFREVVVTVAIALLLAWGVQAFLVKPFQIPSESMENTIQVHDRVLANRIGYRFHDPHRGDIVVFHPNAASLNGRIDRSMVAGLDGGSGLFDAADRPEPANAYFIKRLIGLPGDTVTIKGHYAYVNGKRLREPYVHIDGTPTGPLANMQRLHVPAGRYLMLGDHRDCSGDGRVFGFIPRSSIVGAAFMVYWPPKRFGGIPHADPSPDDVAPCPGRTPSAAPAASQG